MALNVKGLLKKGAEKAPEKEKKDDTPTVQLAASEVLVKAHTKWVEAKKKIVQGEADRKQAEELMIPEAEKGRIEHCLKNGKFHSSIKAKFGECSPLTYSTQNRYSEITQDKEERLQQIFTDKFPQCIKEITSIELSDEAMVQVDVLLPRLVEAVGKHFNLKGEAAEAKFLEMFSISRVFKPTEYLHENRVVDPNVKQMAQTAINEGLLIPTKGSFRNS